MQDYHRLDIWQRSMEYTVQVYAYTANLPPEERYGLAAQLRKAAISVPLNVAEGDGLRDPPRVLAAIRRLKTKYS
jgi:four helix bundle protein